MIRLWLRFRRESMTENGKWLDDGDCIICNKCKKVLDERYVERKGDSVRVPFHCPFCNDYKEDIIKA